MKIIYCVLGCFSLGMFLACGGAATSNVNYGQADDLHTELEACVQGQLMMKRLLKYPDDAEFQWGAVASKMDNGLWRVVGKVKAANGFGAKLTNVYIVSMSLDTETKTWTMQGARLGDEILYVSSSPIPETAEAKKEREKTDKRLAEERQRREAKHAAEVAAQEKAEKETYRRTWTSKDRQFSVDAYFVSQGNGKVILERVDNGNEISVSTAILVPNDVNEARLMTLRKNGKAKR